MPRDQRLYMTFPIDMHRHPKLKRLPVAVRWTFIEMNGEARIADNDGVFTEADAEFMWPKKHLEALVGSHPERPLLVHENGTYILREFAEHQETRATREKRAETNRENGLKGGRPPKNPDETHSVTGRLQTKANGTQKNPESESASDDSLQDLSTSSYVPSAPIPDDDEFSLPTFPPPLPRGVDLTKLAAAVWEHARRVPSEVQMQLMTDRVIGRTPGKITSQTRLMLSSAKNDWAEWQQLVDAGVAS